MAHARQPTEVTCKAPGRTRIPGWNLRRPPTLARRGGAGRPQPGTAPGPATGRAAPRRPRRGAQWRRPGPV
ncbi:hypothetical protein HMPREF1317_1169 [Schaalia georgiae F0490]|uniref:Uncharacterized protein n=1 Tax=Schaalia georgiae F0490 TaxID=1125717 RepID=J0NHK2_9ACTO|nr:hypothetical protein HMPREF1317_1169 [Schaalia georgiae F0490]